jgi:hypothetical protein
METRSIIAKCQECDGTGWKPMPDVIRNGVPYACRRRCTCLPPLPAQAPARDGKMSAAGDAVQGLL